MLGDLVDSNPEIWLSLLQPLVAMYILTTYAYFPTTAFFGEQRLPRGFSDTEVVRLQTNSQPPFDRLSIVTQYPMRNLRVACTIFPPRPSYDVQTLVFRRRRSPRIFRLQRQCF